MVEAAIYQNRDLSENSMPYRYKKYNRTQAINKKSEIFLKKA